MDFLSKCVGLQVLLREIIYNIFWVVVKKKLAHINNMCYFVV